MLARPDPPADAVDGAASAAAPITSTLSRRAEALDLTIRALRARAEPDRVLICELAWEMHEHGYWSQLRRTDGSVYDSEETYFREALGLTSWRTAYKRLAIGRMLWRFSGPERARLRASLAQVGLAKASIIVPAIEQTMAWEEWTTQAHELTYMVLQVRVSAALQALPRGREPSPPGERFRQAVLSAMPDIEAMEVVERFFALGARVVGTTNPVGIFLAGCRECLADWEVHAAAQRRTKKQRADEDGQDAYEQNEGAGRCPRGQTANGRPALGATA